MKNKILLSQLVNMDAMARLEASKDDTQFKDSEGGLVLARNLEVIDPRIFEQKFPGLTFMGSGVGVDNTGGYGKSITKIKLGEQGDFTYSGDKSSNKGKITLGAQDDTIQVFQIEGFSDWDDTEIKQAEMENINLVQRFIQAHNKRYNHKLDEIGYVGHTYNLDGSAKTEGLLNYSGFTTGAAAGAVTTLTAQQQYDAIAGLITDQWNSVFNVPEYMANKLTMPVRVMNTISRTILNTANGSSTVMAALKSNFPGVDFQSTNKAESVAGTSRTVAWSNNQDAMIFRVPQPLEIGEIVKQGSFAFHVDSKARIAGLDVAEDDAGRILTGL